MLAAGRVHADLWLAGQLEDGAEAASVPHCFYRYCDAHDLVARIPTAGVVRPVVDPDYIAIAGLTRDEARALVAAADADRGRQALRIAAVVRLLLHNALRVHEVCAADVAGLGAEAGHRVLRVTRKGARKAKVPLTPATVAALDAYLADRGARAGQRSAAALTGPFWPRHLVGGCGRGTYGSWSAASPWPPTSTHGGTCRRTDCVTRRSPSPSTPASPCATCRTTPGTKDPRTTRYDHSRWTP